MADKQISQLVAATTLNNEDLLVIQQGQIAKKLSGERLAMFVYLAAGSMIDEVNSAVEEAQAAVDELLEEKNAIAQTIADMAGLGTDTTLTTPAMAADSKAVGDRIADVEKDALAGLNQKTISDVAIASFDDGADDAPVKELIVNINPVQDLHGQDAPYPAGCGVNKWDEAWENGSYNTTTGEKEPKSNYIRSVNAIPILPSTSYQTSKPSGGLWFGFYDSNGTYLSTIDTAGGVITTPADAYFMRFHTYNGYGSTYKNDISINYPSTVEGYYPYSNICPITGWTGCEVKRTGKNLTPNTVTVGLNINSDGTESTNTSASTSDFIPVKTNVEYTFSVNQNITGVRIEFYDAEKHFISRTGTVNKNHTFTPGSNVKYIRWTLNYNSTTGATTQEVVNSLEPQFERGSVRTTYEPYSGTTISITFPSEAGTVYGARLNLTTGKLIVDTAARQFDGSGDVYSFVSNGRVNIDFAGIDYKKGLDKDSGISNSYAGLMQTANNANFDSSAINYASCYNISASDNNFTVRIKDPRFVDLNTAQGILEEEPLVIIFNLNTPIVYNLTPIEVRTLLKINNIWANTGNINTLIYRTIPITEEVIREIMGDYEKIIAGVESTGKATKNYYAGDLVIVNDILYKCLVNVASGETFTPGAGGNVSQTTIADELATLQALYDNLGNLALLSYTTA